MQPTAEQSTSTALDALLKKQALTGDWVLDAGDSSVWLTCKSLWGLVPVTGEFREVSGHGTVTADAAASGTIRMASASVDTKNPKRDTHLRSADFFDSASNP